MRSIILNHVIFLLYVCIAISAHNKANAQSFLNPCSRWQLTDTLIRDNKIDLENALDSLRIYVKKSEEYCKSINLQFTERENWVFPMRGFTHTEYRNNGQDYKDETFDYFQGGEYSGHPAHDIFILDADSNGAEDITGKPVDAVAMTSGLVFSVYSVWDPANMLRSGNYIKIFDPASEAIFYYSHVDSVTVSVGQVVKAGEKVGTVGRTGRKAFRGRTHLHIAYYKIINGYPKPEDIVKDLRDAERRDSQNKN